MCIVPGGILSIIKLLLIHLLGLVGQGESKTNKKPGGESCLMHALYCTSPPPPSLSGE